MDTAAAALAQQQRRWQRPSWLPWARRQAVVAAVGQAPGRRVPGRGRRGRRRVGGVRRVRGPRRPVLPRHGAHHGGVGGDHAAAPALALPAHPPEQRLRPRHGPHAAHVLILNVLELWILGNPIKVEGAEHLKTRGIFICNHASPLDIFLVMWLAPTGTVGIAKKEIIWYPLFGQLYVLANHLRIDRSNPAAAIHSMKQVARAVVKNNLSLILFPEGTRSKNGRLLPFKKGFVHAALQTGLPVVPIVVTGTHLAWRNNSVRVRPVPLTVKVLPPIGTAGWEEARAGEHAEAMRSLYACNLPDSQKPLHAPPLAAPKSD